MIKFKYTKANGSTTNRTGVVINRPIKNYGILDVSELSEDEQIEIAEQVAEFQAARAAAMAELEVKFGMRELYTNYFKNFKPEGVEVIS